MKNKKYKLIRNNNLEIDNKSDSYNIIVVLKFFDLIVLIKDIIKYDYIRFEIDSIEEEIILKKIKNITRIESKLVFKNVLKNNQSKEDYYLYSLSIDSIQLATLKECLDVKICKKSYIKHNFNDDKFEILNYMREYNHFEDVFLILIPLAILIAIGIAIYKIVTGKIDFELIVGIITAFFIILIVIIGYKKNR